MFNIDDKNKESIDINIETDKLLRIGNNATPL